MDTKQAEIKKGVENELEQYTEISETAHGFVKENQINFLDLALLMLSKRFKKHTASELSAACTGGFRILGRVYTQNPETLRKNGIPTLRQKGFMECKKKGTKGDILTLSPLGKTLLSDFTTLMKNRLKKKEKIIQIEKTLDEKVANLLSGVMNQELNELTVNYPDTRSLYIDFQKLQVDDIDIADELLMYPEETIEIFQKEIEKLNLVIQTTKNEQKFNPHIRVRNMPEEYTPLIRDITEFYIKTVGPLVACEGIIRSKTLVDSKIDMALYICNKCGEMHEEPQLTSLPLEPISCKNCRRRDFRLVPKSSKFIDTQIIEIQEPMNLIENGSQARTIRIILSDDLRDTAEVGDRVLITGLIQRLPPKRKGLIYSRIIEALSLIKTEELLDLGAISDEEMEEISNLSNDPKLFEKIRDSIAPSIYGHNHIKMGLLLLLFGGRKDKRNAEGVSVRSDIHMLLCGDPSTAKSRLLQYIASIAAKCIQASGKGASGCGLTATVTKDELNPERWVVKGGATVVGSGGVVCIDEFDKMNKDDRDNMHDVMATQQLQITKADIITTLQTKTTILAAANPKFSRFDKYQPFLEQFDLPASLISRFDLIFPLQDRQDPDKDRNIAKNIIKSHSCLLSEDDGEFKESDAPISLTLLRKYIFYAREHVFPLLTEESKEILIDKYVRLRATTTDTRIVTPRQLEGLIRLAEASAKVRLSSTIEVCDVERAISLYVYSIEQIATDPESGVVDIDFIMTTHPATLRTKIRHIEDIIKNSSNENGEVSISTVLQKAAKDEGIDDKACRKIIRELKSKGVLYEPRHNTLKYLG